MKYWLLAGLLTTQLAIADDAIELHKRVIVIDTHSDFLDRSAIDGSRLNEDPPFAQTTLSKLQEGQIDAQFFSVFVPPAFEEYGFARRTFELIDRMIQEIEASPEEIQLATSVDHILTLAGQNKIAALMGIEGGHSIKNDLRLLRTYYRLGIRYMTLTWNNTNEWADASGGEVRWQGLNAFGESVVAEMNRLGMMIDISHVSDETFWDVIAITKAPVIASHSLARAVNDSPRNMSDEMIMAIADNDGVIQVSFYAQHLDRDFSAAKKTAMASAASQFDTIATEFADDPIRMDILQWSLEQDIERTLQPPPMERVVDHIDHIVRIAGIDHVGIGSDFDGLGLPPAGLEHIGKLANITAELSRRGYKDEDIEKIMGGNLLRVMKTVEQLAEHST